MCFVKIFRFEKNKNKLYYGCDFGCRFNSWCAPLNDPKGYTTEEYS